MRSRSSTSSWTSQAKPMLPRWAWERVSISAALWRAVSRLPRTLAYLRFDDLFAALTARVEEGYFDRRRCR